MALYKAIKWTDVDFSSIKSCGFRYAQDINHYNVFENYTFKIAATFARVSELKQIKIKSNQLYIDGCVTTQPAR